MDSRRRIPIGVRRSDGIQNILFAKNDARNPRGQKWITQKTILFQDCDFEVYIYETNRTRKSQFRV